MLYLQKSFIGTFPFLPPSRKRLWPWRTEACLLREDGDDLRRDSDESESEAGVTGVHIWKRRKDNG